jgi:DNA modification methylase
MIVQNSLHQLMYVVHEWEFNIFAFEILLIFKFYLLIDLAWYKKKTHVINPQIRWAYNMLNLETWPS